MKSMTSRSQTPAPIAVGTGVVAGVAWADVLWARPRPALPQPGPAIAEDKRDEEFERFVAAADAVADRLETRAASQIAADAGDSGLDADVSGVHSAAADILNATAGMARDRGWRKTAKKHISNGSDAVYASAQATEKFTTMFAAAGGVMAERVTDLEDVRDRVIAELRGEEEPGLPEITGPVVLFADDLSPADTATLDTNFVKGLVTVLGGPTSHTAIIARQLNLPCIVAAGSSAKRFDAGERVLVDGALGTVRGGVAEEEAATLLAEAEALAAKIAAWTGPARTSDGHRVQLLANVADGNAARIAAGTQAEGVGLYRTEMSFLSAASEPSVEKQAAEYAKVLQAFPHSKVVIRTLDAGSDKPLAFANHTDEDNPALGVRGLRIARGTGRDEGLMTRQLDAIAAAAASVREDDGEGRDPKDTSATWVMAPMVATADEAAWFANLCRERGLTAGAMIEVPAAALMADKIMPHVDFVSIGTNDLTQYTMAADRLSAGLAELTDPWQPAVLRLIENTCRAGRDTDTTVGVCGEAAADPLLACVLVGLGVDSLSAAATAVAGVGAQLADVTFEQCRKAADLALSADGAAAARAAVRELLRG